MKKNQTGFTLIEVLIYSFIFSLFLLLITQIFLTIKATSANSLAMVNLQQNQVRIYSDLNQTIRNSEEPVLPAMGSSAASLSLNNGQIVYQVDEGVLNKVIDSNSIALSDQGISVTDISFESLGEIGQKVSIKIHMTISSNYILEGNRVLSEDFQTTINLR